MNKGAILVIATICIFIFAISGCRNENTKVKASNNAIEKVLTLPRGPNNPRNSEGDFVTLKDGRILFVYSHYTGDSYMDDAPAYLASRYSDDNGQTWTKEDQVIVEKEGKKNVMSVSLLRLQNGEIALFYLRVNSLQDCMPMVRFSSDEGKTWTEPKACINTPGYYILHNNRVIQLKDGRLVFAVAFSGKICSYYSDDDGRNWKASAIMPNPDHVVTQEPGIVELKNGDIFMIMRTDTTTQYVAYSKDRGQSWSPAHYSNIVSARQSPASIARIPSTADLLLVWNNNNSADSSKLKANRTPLNIAISKDEGKTWIDIKTLEDNPKGSFCYTAIHFVGNEVLLAYFDWATTQITITKVNIDWLYNVHH